MALFTDPPVVTVPASPFIVVDVGIPRSFVHRAGGAIWSPGWYPAGALIQQPAVIKSTDGGATWAFKDQANTPSIDQNVGYIDFAFDGALIHILGRRVPTDMAYCVFDTSAGAGAGQFGTQINSGITNGFYKIAVYNSNPIAIYTPGGNNQPLKYSIISSGSFGSPVNLVAGTVGKFYAPLSTILDSSGTLHVLYSISGSPQTFWHVSLDSGGGISTPVQVESSGGTGTPRPVGMGAVWTDLSTVDHLLWAQNKGSSVVLYDGAADGSSWTTRTVATLSPSSQATSFVAQVIVSGGVPYIWWYYVRLGTTSQVQYCTFDGSTFTSPLVAWDAYANPAAGDPGGVEIDSFCIAANGTGWDLMADEFIDASFNQSHVFLTQGGVVILQKNRFSVYPSPHAGIP